MTSKHDGPRPGAPVTVIQAATPTRLTQAEAEELDRLIDAALKARMEVTLAARHPGPDEAYAVDRDAYSALRDWQRRHGLESK